MNYSREEEKGLHKYSDFLYFDVGLVPRNILGASKKKLVDRNL